VDTRFFNAAVNAVNLAVVKRFLIILAAVFAVAQFIRPDTSLPARDPAQDLIAITRPNAEVADLLHATCYDCHSSETKYPWYVNMTPVNWWMQHHVNEARGEFNMSDWGSFTAKRQRHKAEEGVEMLENEEMPLPSYTWSHAEAKLNPEQRAGLAEYFKELRDALPAPPAGESH